MLPVDEEWRADDLQGREPDELRRRRAYGQHREQPADSTQKDGPPDRTEEHPSSLDGGDEPEHGDAEFDPAKVRSAFAELDGLKRALGRSTFAALQTLLPFDLRGVIGHRSVPVPGSVGKLDLRANVVANSVALLPARAAARTQPAAVLRSE